MVLTMKEKKLISIIVPVYNVEKYLPRCVESILAQTYDAWELLLVDDGSKDCSAKICDDYARKDPRIRAIRQANGGVSAARNTGIAAAAGEFLTFIDSDDWVEHDYLAKLVALMSGTSVQLAVGMYDLRDLSITAPKALDFQQMDFQNPKLSECCALFENLAMWVPWAKLFLNRIIQENNLRFSMHVKHGEDTLFLYEYLQHCRCIQITNDSIYHYNRMVGTAATRKYYEDFPVWKTQIMTAFEKLVSGFEMPDEDKNKLLARMAAVNFCGIVERCTASKSRQEAIAAIGDGFMDFKEKMFLDTAWKDMQSYSQDLLQAILAGDMECVYDQQIAAMKNHRFKKFVKRYLKMIATPIIERTRDGLLCVSQTKA